MNYFDLSNHLKELLSKGEIVKHSFPTRYSTKGKEHQKLDNSLNFNKNNSSQLKNFLISHWPPIIYFLLTILILWQMLLPGYLFFLDYQPFSEPTTHMIERIFSDANSDLSRGIGWISFSLLGDIFGDMLAQKIILFLVIFFTAYLSYKFVPFVRSKKAKFFAGIMFLVNPFIYFRLISGQVGVIIGAILLFVVIKLLMDYFESRNKLKALKIGLILAFMAGISLHFFAMFCFFVFPLFFLFYFWKEYSNKDSNLKKFILDTLVLFGLIVLVNLFWVALMFVPSSGFGFSAPYDETYFFQSRALDQFNTALTSITMYGFWHESYPKAIDMLPSFIWLPLFLVILFVSVRGFVEEEDFFKKTPFALLALIAVIFATGVSAPATKAIFDFFFESIPFFSGFREPGKFIALIVMFYSVFGAVFIDRLSFSLEKSSRKIFLALTILLLIILPLIFSFNLFFGLNGFINSHELPKEYYSAKEFLSLDNSNYQMVYFPFHMYIQFSFSDYKTATPFAWFFNKETIVGTDTMAHEFGVKQMINDNINSQNKVTFSKQLAKYNVKYIILANELDYSRYNFLENSLGFSKVFEEGSLRIFENHWWEEEKPVPTQTNPLTLGLFILSIIGFIGGWIFLSKKQNEDTFDMGVSPSLSTDFVYEEGLIEKVEGFFEPILNVFGLVWNSLASIFISSNDSFVGQKDKVYLKEILPIIFEKIKDTFTRRKLSVLIESNNFYYVSFSLIVLVILSYFTLNLSLALTFLFLSLILSFSYFKLELLKIINIEFPPTNWDKLKAIFIILFAITATYFFFQWFGIEAWYLVLITLFVLLTIFFDIDYRITIASALLMLVLCPVLLILKQDKLAEQVAVWVYILLVTGVTSAILDLMKHPKGWKEEQKDCDL